MTQLTGLTCALCNERIASVLDGEFCSTCGCPIHSRCAMPGTTRSGACTACGADAAAAAAHQQRSEEEAAAQARGLRSHHVTWGTLLLGLGIPLLAIGVASVVMSISALSEERGFILWYGAILVGAGLTLRGLAHFRALWAATRATKRT